MAEEIISLDSWLSTPLGQYLLAWEQQRISKAVEDIFGYHALQLGLPSLPALENNRMPNRWLVQDHLPGQQPAASPFALVSRFDALPFAEQSIDLVVLPHTLDLAVDPHATLREVSRVLVPEGRVVITCLNPASLWGLRQRRTRFLQRLGANSHFLPLGAGSLIGYWRLRDWLRLLGLEVATGSFGCYRPAFQTQKWLDRTVWMESAGDRWWPILGAAFQITAIKRIKGMRLIGPQWKTEQNKNAKGAVATQRMHQEKQQNQ